MIYLLGASGQAKVVFDLLDSLGVKCAGLYDDAYEAGIQERNGFSLLDKITAVENKETDAGFHVAIGINSIREKIARAKDQLSYPVLIHPSAVIAKSANLAAGSICMAGSIIQAAAKIGKHCIINTKASVDHDCVLQDFAQVAPGATVCGNVTIGECSYVGAGAVIKQGISIGSHVMIGAGAVVIKDIPDNCMAVGNPARIIKEGKFV
jgi:sugar O-acyltransferase (sialic acid O-acetyltransferase NeuD family)